MNFSDNPKRLFGLLRYFSRPDPRVGHLGKQRIKERPIRNGGVRRSSAAVLEYYAQQLAQNRQVQSFMTSDRHRNNRVAWMSINSLSARWMEDRSKTGPVTSFIRYSLAHSTPSHNPRQITVEMQRCICYHPIMDTQTSSEGQTRKPVYTYEAPINQRGMLVIPQDLRKRMGIQPHDRIQFQVYANAVEIASAKPMTLEEAFGSVTPLQAGQDLAEVIQAAKAEHYLDRFDRKHRS